MNYSVDHLWLLPLAVILPLAAVLLLQPAALAGAILLRAMAPLSQTRPVDLTGKAVLIASGMNDPIISSQSAARLASALQRYGANVEHRT